MRDGLEFELLRGFLRGVLGQSLRDAGDEQGRSMVFDAHRQCIENLMALESRDDCNLGVGSNLKVGRGWSIAAKAGGDTLTCDVLCAGRISKWQLRRAGRQIAIGPIGRFGGIVTMMEATGALLEELSKEG